MSGLVLFVILLAWIASSLACWLGWQLLRQNGRILLRLDELEKRLDEFEFDESSSSRHEEALTGNSEFRDAKSESDQSLVTSAATSPFGIRSLVRSRIKRDGLKAGTPAPDFRLPRLDGGELSVEELRGKRLLLVFSDPHCGPCNALLPQVEAFHRQHPEVEVVMISRCEPKENRAKVKEHRLTFPVVLQQRWEISRLYAMFATPVAYLIDEAGVVARDVVVGVEPILNLMTKMNVHPNEKEVALS